MASISSEAMVNEMGDLDGDSLRMHRSGRPGKIEIIASKPLVTQRDLALAYSPGVAAPCLEIAKDPSTAYDYTAKGNLVAVISNGTAVLGLGDLGALGGKPVMEGKAVLFKRFADVDCMDLEVDTRDVDEFVNCVRFLGPTFGGINLEDIKAPECFIIEQRLREMMDIPIFHDDQHGTAIVSAAGLINAMHLTGRDLRNVRMVVNGAGAASIACIELVKAMGLPPENAILCDTKGVIYQGRTEGMNQWKSAHAVRTKARSLAEAIEGADVFFGLSVKGAVTRDMVKSMAASPIIFAMANPDPEITPEDVRAARSDAIIATGRSDYPNQINNVLGFPYIFRGALDVRATTINEAMKIAAAEALAKLAREDVPDEVDRAYSGRRLRYGPDYIVPVPFDPRLISAVSSAVAEAAVKSGVARKPIPNLAEYKRSLSGRLDPTSHWLQSLFEQVKANPQRIVFAEGEEERTIRAALVFRDNGYGTPILIGREEQVRETMKALGIANTDGLEIHNARLSTRNTPYTDMVYKRLQRDGYLRRDVQRMVNQGRNVFGACMVAMGDADGMVTGITRRFPECYGDVKRVIDAESNKVAMGYSIVVARHGTVFLADTSINETPTPEQLAAIARQMAANARMMGHHPRVAFTSFTNFGSREIERIDRIRKAIRILDAEKVDFEYDGEMQADMALDHELLKATYPFCRLTGPANVLVMPGLHSAHISSRLVQSLGGVTVIGPVIDGLQMPVQIVAMGATVSDLVNHAALAAYGALSRRR
ncbi:NADP-dependent malic enzyme [Enhydrobacter sp.]|jgi:malate dehydrogenase (oxaloacetate-decarboxylating)(NADP+)|uniref:NADP-dependent malic enzyme n=1 Tax=Enhydrobacter sp. TaxID=1894999 RepID=UPI0026234574|nr:NADP-dependent malic enzyme [Enhydrobacter sp.]WIM11136.1 MAG: NADP-dependent malic enzyme [Enhydrobacter sp.]